MLVTSASGKGKIVLLRKIDGRAHLDGQVTPGEGLIKLLPVQHACAAPGALVHYPFG